MLVMVGINELLWSPALWTSYGYFFERQDFLSLYGLNFYAIFSPDYASFYTEHFGEIGMDLSGILTENLRTPWLLYVQRFFMNFTIINLGLCLFNLLPIPPLDGYHVVNDIFLRGRLHIPANVVNGLMIGLLILMYATNIISDILSEAMAFVQNGVLSGILTVFGLG